MKCFNQERRPNMHVNCTAATLKKDIQFVQYSAVGYAIRHAGCTPNLMPTTLGGRTTQSPQAGHGVRSYPPLQLRYNWSLKTREVSAILGKEAAGR